MDNASIPANVLVRAFELAWLRMLNDELVTADNIVAAPMQLMTAIITAASESGMRAETLSERAFLQWRVEHGDRTPWFDAEESGTLH